VRVNRAYADAGTRPPEEFVGRNHFELYPHEENQAIFAGVRDTGEPYSVRAKAFEYADHPEWGVTYWDWSLTPIVVDGEAELYGLWLRDVTGQERAKQALEAQRDSLEELVRARTAELQETTALLQAIIQASPLAIAVHDTQGTVRLWNPAAEVLSGFSAQEALGQPSPLVPPDKMDEYRRNLATLTAGGEIRNAILERQHKDGARRLLELNAAPLREADGRPRGNIVIFGDVTEREQMAAQLEAYADRLQVMVDEATAELQASREQLRRQHAFVEAVIEEAAVLVIVVTAEGFIVRFNAACERVSGYAAEEAVGRSFVELLIRPEERAQTTADLQRVVVEGPIDYESWWLTKPGELRRITWRFANLQDESGATAFVVATGLDVTDQRRIEQALADSEEQYRQLVQSANSIIIRWDADGTIRFINDYGLAFFGYTQDELVGQRIGILVPETDSYGTDLRSLVEEIVERPQDFWVNENENVTRDGRRVWISWSNRAIHDEDGRLAGIMAVGVDRTLQREMDVELRRSRENLRTLAARLAAAERRERQEIAGMLHDNLGQLLAFAKMALSATSADDLIPEQATRLRTVREYLDEAIAFTRSLTTQLSPPVLSQLGFGAALQWLGDDLEQRHHIAIRVETEKLEGIDQEISVMLFQAVREALYNAIKHAEADEVTVRAMSKGTHVLVEVEDNGVGFELTSLDVGVGREGGFGLFNVREQLSYLGGHLEIESEPGSGTRVVLLCPPTAAPKRPSP